MSRPLNTTLVVARPLGATSGPGEGAWASGVIGKSSRTQVNNGNSKLRSEKAVISGL